MERLPCTFQDWRVTWNEERNFDRTLKSPACQSAFAPRSLKSQKWLPFFYFHHNAESCFIGFGFAIVPTNFVLIRPITRTPWPCNRGRLYAMIGVITSPNRKRLAAFFPDPMLLHNRMTALYIQPTKWQGIRVHYPQYPGRIMVINSMKAYNDSVQGLGGEDTVRKMFIYVA